MRHTGGVRLFAALQPPVSVLAQVQSAVRPLRRLPGADRLRWTARPGWHITLAFFGEVPEDKRPALEARLFRAARRCPAFRLRLAGRSRLLHAAFRVESLVHTPLFAGFPGFGTKLWLTDTGTGVYRGLYEWDGEARARAYAETLCRLLRLVSEPGSVAFHVLPGRRRDEVLATAHARPGPWWEVAA